MMYRGDRAGTPNAVRNLSAIMAFSLAFALLAGPRLQVFDVHAASVLMVSAGYLVFGLASGKIDKPLVSISAFLFPSLLYAISLALLLPLGTMEFSYVLARAYVYAFAAAGLVKVYIHAYGSDWAVRLLRHVVFLWAILALSGISFVLIPWYRGWVGENFFMDGNYHWVESGYRAYDLVSGGAFNGAFGYVIVVFIIALLWRRLRFSGLGAILLGLFVGFGGVLMARSFLVLFLVGLFTLLALMFIRAALKRELVVRKAWLTMPLVVLVSFLIAYASFSVLPDHVRSWAFEFVDGDGRGLVMPGSLETIVGRMYFLPEGFVETLFGGGYLGRWESGPYVRSDVGYVRVLFNSGVLGLLLIIVPLGLLWGAAVYRYLRDGDGVALLLACLIVLIAVGNAKELFVLPRNTGVLVLLVLFLYMKDRYRRVAWGWPHRETRVRGFARAFGAKVRVSA